MYGNGLKLQIKKIRIAKRGITESILEQLSLSPLLPVSVLVLEVHSFLSISALSLLFDAIISLSQTGISIACCLRDASSTFAMPYRMVLMSN